MTEDERLHQFISQGGQRRELALDFSGRWPRGRRQALLAAALALAAGLFAAGLLARSSDVRLAIDLGVVLLYGACASLLPRLIPFKDADERQRGELLFAHRAAYWAAGVPFLVSLLSLQLLSRRLPASELPFSHCLFVCLWFWSLLPRGVLAWRAPDPADEADRD